MQLGDKVRLVREVDSVRPGAVGRIFGSVRGPNLDAFVVAFDGEPSRILEEPDPESADGLVAPHALGWQGSAVRRLTAVRVGHP